MLFTKKKRSQAVAQLRLDKPPSSDIDAPYWLSNETVSGCAVYQLPEGLDLTQSKVTLKGTVRTTTSEQCPGAFQPTIRREKLDFLGFVLDSKPKAGFKGQNGVVKVPFRFNLADCERASPWVVDLPPSADSKPETRRGSKDDQFTITYTITATGLSSNSIVASTTQKITVMPVSEEIPQPATVPGEFFMAKEITPSTKASTSISIPPLSRTSSSSSPAFRTYIAAQEPAALILNPYHDSSSQLTYIPIVLKLSPPTGKALDEGSLPSQCQIKATLVAKDTFTPDFKRMVDSALESMPYSGEHSSQQRRSQEQHSLFTLPAWNSYNLSSAEPFSLSKFSLPFHIKDDKTPTPSFFTPLLSRKYSIELILSFPGTAAQSWKLSLPVEIMNQEHDIDDHSMSRKKSEVSIAESRL